MTKNSFYGKKHTETTKLIISIKNKQRIGKACGGAPKGTTPWNKGKQTAVNVVRICSGCFQEFKTRPYRNKKFCSKKCSQLYASYMASKKSPWNKGLPWNDDVKEKIRQKALNREWSEKSRLKVSRTIRKLYADGKITHADVSGANNPNWKGGTKYAPYHFNFNYKTRLLVRERDNYTCAVCNEYGNVIHHIDGDKSNPNPRLITVCSRCHGRVEMNTNKYRPILSELFERRWLLFES